MTPAEIAFALVITALQPPLPCDYPPVTTVEAYGLQHLATAPRALVHGAYLTRPGQTWGTVTLVEGEKFDYMCHEMGHYVMTHCMKLPKDAVQEARAEGLEKLCHE